MFLDRFTASGLPAPHRLSVLAAILILGSIHRRSPAGPGLKPPPAQPPPVRRSQAAPSSPQTMSGTSPSTSCRSIRPRRCTSPASAPMCPCTPTSRQTPSMESPSPSSTRTLSPSKITFDYAGESDPGAYPIPPNALIEGGANAPADSDRHILLVDKDRCMLMELWSTKRLSDTAWKGGSGIKMDLTSNKLRADGATSADAAGLPILPRPRSLRRSRLRRDPPRACASPSPKLRMVTSGPPATTPPTSMTADTRPWASASACAPTSISPASPRRIRSSSPLSNATACSWPTTEPHGSSRARPTPAGTTTTSTSSSKSKAATSKP
jgi:hypothetical protein